jgi:hypothetical protein
MPFRVVYQMSNATIAEGASTNAYGEDLSHPFICEDLIPTRAEAEEIEKELKRVPGVESTKIIELATASRLSGAE